MRLNPKRTAPAALMLALLMVAGCTRRPQELNPLLPAGGNATVQPSGVEGRVIDTNGNPIARAFAYVTGTNIQAQNPTDSLGRYNIPGAPLTSQVSVAAQAAGFVTGQTSAFQGASAPDLQLKANAPLTLKGTVTRLSDGSAILGATVVVNGRYLQAVTDSNGAYTIANASMSPISLTAQANGFAEQTISLAPVVGQYLYTGLSFVLTGAAGITGHVTNAITGLPLAGVVVSYAVNGSTIQTAKTASDGSYTLANVPVGPDQLTATYPGFQTTVVTIQVNASGQSAGDIGMLPVAGSLYGTVVDQSGNLLPAIQLSVLGTDIQSTTDAAGNFNLLNVPSGTYTIQMVYNTGGMVETASQGGVVVSAGQRTRQNLTFVLGSDVKGNVQGNFPSPGTNLANVSVRMIRQSDGQLIASTTTDSVGNYDFGSVMTTAVTLTFNAPGWNTPVANLPLPSSPTTFTENESFTPQQFFWKVDNDYCDNNGLYVNSMVLYCSNGAHQQGYMPPAGTISCYSVDFNGNVIWSQTLYPSTPGGSLSLYDQGAGHFSVTYTGP